MHIHKYNPWSEVVDTNDCFNKVQFCNCKICNKVKWRRIKLWFITDSYAVIANVINKVLNRTKK